MSRKVIRSGSTKAAWLAAFVAGLNVGMPVIPVSAADASIRDRLVHFNASDYYASDSDGDGIIDMYDRNPGMWNVTERDLRFFMEMSYRTEEENRKIFSGDEEAVKKFNSESMFNVADIKELLPHWKFVKQINAPDGFSASIYANGRQAVIGIAGTSMSDSGDLQSDAKIFVGKRPPQADNLSKLKSAMADYDQYFLTGHSLGGYLSVYYAATEGVNDDRMAHVSVFNAPGISYKYVINNSVHWNATKKAEELTDASKAPSYTEDSDSRFVRTISKVQPYGIHGDSISGLYQFRNTFWRNQVNSGSKHSSSNFFGKSKDDKFREYYSTGYRLDSPYMDMDTDQDGILDADELHIGTDYKKMDSDSDGFSDRVELAAKSDPIRAEEKPKLADLYLAAITGALKVKNGSEVTAEALRSKSSVGLDGEMQPYSKEIPSVFNWDVYFRALNLPDNWDDVPGTYIVDMQAEFPDGSKSDIYKLPVIIESNTMKEKLRSLANKADDLRKEPVYYNSSDSKRDEYERMLKEANDILKKADATQEEINLAEQRLQKAQDALDGKPTQTDELKRQVDQYSQIMHTAEYYNASPDKKKAYEAVLAQAREMLAKSDQTQSAVDKMTENLRTAQGALDGKESDKSKLRDAVEQKDQVFGSEKYMNASDETVRSYHRALAEADLVLEDNSASQAMINYAYEQVEKSRKELDGKDTDRSLLTQEVNRAESVFASDAYQLDTKEKQEAYKKALEEAKSALQKQAISQQDADYFLSQLTRAREALSGEREDPIDSDGDGYPDVDELNAGSDPHDEKSTPLDVDADGYSNEEEEKAGSDPRDKNSTPETVDHDGDGYPDKIELEAGSDPKDPKSTPDDIDGDGYSNKEEEKAGSDPRNKVSTPETVDRDGDGYPDKIELEAGSDPSDRNSTPYDLDGDGYDNDREEKAGSDPRDKNSTPETVDRDGDGYTDVQEKAAGSDPRDSKSTPKDIDGDGYSNEEEEKAGSDPKDKNSTPETVDRDHDGYPDLTEKKMGSNPDDPKSTPEDLDGDGYSNEEEKKADSDPNNKQSVPDDRDGDGYSNGEEEKAGSNPDDMKSIPEDLDGDGYSNEEEIKAGSDPRNSDSTPETVDEKPDQPDEPEKPDQPGEPEKPDQPGEPEKPDQPSEPEKPDQPGEPEKPDQPSEPEKPDQPDEPKGQVGIRNPDSVKKQYHTENGHEAIKQKTDIAPQTGDKTDYHYHVVVVFSTLVAGILSLCMKLRNRREDGE